MDCFTENDLVLKVGKPLESETDVEKYMKAHKINPFKLF